MSTTKAEPIAADSLLSVRDVARIHGVAYEVVDEFVSRGYVALKVGGGTDHYRDDRLTDAVNCVCAGVVLALQTRSVADGYAAAATNIVRLYRWRHLASPERPSRYLIFDQEGGKLIPNIDFTGCAIVLDVAPIIDRVRQALED